MNDENVFVDSMGEAWELYTCSGGFRMELMDDPEVRTIVYPDRDTLIEDFHGEFGPELEE